MNRAADNSNDDMDEGPFDLSLLDAEERTLVRDLISFAEEHPDARTAEYRNYYVRRVGGFYEARGLSRKETTKTTVWQIAQNIAGRLMVASGIARDSDDYREKLDALIREKYGSRRRFCELTGISEDMLSHVLAKRKHMSIQSLSDALAKIGYTIQFTQMPDISPPSQQL
jgi:hypothetical protein